jgi:hypothetical protein
MIPDIDPDTIYVNSTQVDDRPMVYWQYRENFGTITINEARERANAIFRAAAMASAEAAIVIGLSNDKPKGFSKNKPQDSKQWQRIGGLLQMMRDFQEPLPEQIAYIFGFHTQKPLIEIEWYGEKIQQEPDIMIAHAQSLLECAEAAESDAFYYYFLQEKLGFSREEAQPLIKEFADFRSRNRLEELFKRGDRG